LQDSPFFSFIKATESVYRTSLYSAGKNFMKKLIVITLLFVCFNNIFAQEMPSFSPDIKRVAVFKNGYAFTYREAETATQSGWAYTTKTPVGVLGTVWGYSTTPNIKINRLLASSTETEKSDVVKIGSLPEILMANQGSRIRFQTFLYNEKKSYEGIYQIIGGENYPTIALKTETATLFVPFSSAYNIELLGDFESKKTVKIPQTENRLSIRVEGAKDGEKINLGVAALEKGISWIPAYRIEAKGEPIKEAKIELEAMLINDLGDMKDSSVYFVVGVPSFLFQNQMSPLSLGNVWSGVSSNIAGNNFASNAIMTQTESKSVREEVDISPTSPDEEQVAAASATQLFLYEGKQIDLKKGERMSMKLFSVTVPCSEVFEWTIEDGRNQTDYSTAPSQTNRIWYGLKLKNTTGMPWTTAPAVAFYDWKPIGQNLMTFTPSGTENVLRITTATEVIGKHEIEELERLPKQIRENGRPVSYDLVTLEGKILLQNKRKEPVDVVLRRNVLGGIVSVSDAGKISKDGTNLQALNPSSNIKWNITIPSGEKEIKYTYKVYVPK
jgi:hypothetical protein